MNEKTVVLKIENVKKRYKIKRLGKKTEGKAAKIKAAVKSFINPNANKEDFWALKGVTFNVEQGEKIGIIGKNGAGKSTLLKIISRITEPTDGRIEMLGKISSMPLDSQNCKHNTSPLEPVPLQPAFVCYSMHK